MEGKNSIAKPMAGIAISVLIALVVALAAQHPSVSINGVPVIFVCAVVAFTIQWLAFIPAYLQQTELFYDLTGSISFIAVTLLALFYGASSNTSGLDTRSLLIASLVFFWALRLGSFLFQRIIKAGKDQRFDSIKPNFMRFLLTWTLQGLWVFLTMACALTAMTTSQPQALGPLAWLGVSIWAIGFGIEVVADAQKSAFRRKTDNTEQFITSGLWAWSRHPNYFGEIVLWAGIAIIALPVLVGWQYLTLISPLFVVLLLTRISGIPLLEQRADMQWGEDPRYQEYKANTPVLLPRLARD